MSTAAQELVVSRASLEDWLEIEQWAADEQWNPGLGDTPLFHPTDPAGFFVGRLGGRAVSAVSVVRYSDAYAFLGYYLVHPDHRGHGLGIATWHAAVPHAGSRTIGLDAVPEQEATYRRSGFVSDYRSVRYAGAPGRRPASDADSTVRVTAAHVGALAEYDRACFPAERRAFLARWLTAPNHLAHARQRDGRTTGYGVIRPARAGHRIGPLFADTPEDAETLFDALVAHLGPADEVYLDVPEPHSVAVELAKSRGLAPVSHSVRMYAGAAPRTSAERIYGSTSLELG